MKQSSQDKPSPLPSWRQRPRPIGPGYSYELKGETLEIDNGRKVEIARLGDVGQIRFYYAPSNISGRSFKTELTFQDGRKIRFGNLSWRSLTDTERDDRRYRAFVSALAAAVVAANPQVRFVAGTARWKWLLLTWLSAASVVLLGRLTLRAFQDDAAPLGWLGLALILGLVWQTLPMMRLNRPRELPSGAVPEDVVPGKEA